MTPEDETRRVATLHDLEILDSAPEPLFDRYVSLAAEIFKTPVALISLVDSDRQWFKARVGLELGETDRSLAFCDHAIRSDETFVVLDAAADARFRQNPLVTGDPGIRFYAGAPLTVRGDRLGTLCVLDFAPHAEFPEVRQLECMAASVAQAIAVRKTGLEATRISRTAADRLRLIEVIESSNQVGTWSWDSARDRMTWSEEVYRIHHHDPDLAEPQMAGLLAAYHPADAARLSAMVGMAMEDLSDRCFQATLVRKDGQQVKASVTRRCAGDGAVIGVLGAFRALQPA